MCLYMDQLLTLFYEQMEIYLSTHWWGHHMASNDRPIVKVIMDAFIGEENGATYTK